jgi:hypothetical protein
MNFYSNCVVFSTFFAVLLHNEVKKYKYKNCSSRIFLESGEKSSRKLDKIRGVETYELNSTVDGNVRTYFNIKTLTSVPH